VQCPVEVAIAATVEPVTNPQATAGLQGRRPGQRSEGGFVADSSTVGPRHQQLRGDDRPDAGLGEQGRPSGMLGDQGSQLGVELVGLGLQEPDPGGDGAQGRHRDPVLDSGTLRGVQGLDAGELAG